MATNTTPAAAPQTKLQSVLSSILMFGATLGTDFVHSVEGQSALGLALVGLEAVVQAIAAEDAKTS